MKTNYSMRRGFTLVELLVVIVIIAALAGLTAPMVIRQRKKADQTEAISNIRQIGLALFEFENEYGTYPSSTTGADVTAATGSALSLSGTDANSYFRQLIAAGYTQSEKMFYAKIPNVKKPDENASDSDTALAAGEVGFGYITKGATGGFSAAGNPARPICATPLLNNATVGTFDTAPFDGKAIVLRMDNSATSINIKTTDNTITLGAAGNGLLDKGADTVWGDITETPTLAAPTVLGE